jgi:mono/diheme cytochrome c family protein
MDLLIITRPVRTAILTLVALGCAREPPPETVPPRLVPPPFASKTSDPAAGPAMEGDLVRGEVLFQTHCTRCHGREGQGDGADAASLSIRPRDLTDGYVRKLSRKHLDRVIRDGGAAVGLSKDMPGFGDTLSEHDIASLIAFTLRR